MKIDYLCIRFFALLWLSAVSAYAIPLASAKVLVANGSASYSNAETESTPLFEGAILSQGDTIVTGNSGVVHLIFSNGVGLTIAEDTELVFSKLEQRSFWRDDPDEIPEEEVSRSTTILELKYGSIKGHVKNLREDSIFRISTEFGNALILGTKFFMELYYDAFRKQFVLNVHNIDGMIDFVTKFSGQINYKLKNIVSKKYESKATVNQVARIPPKHAISIQESSFDPKYKELVSLFPKDAKSRLLLSNETIEPFPADQAREVTVVSPNGTESEVNSVLEKLESNVIEGAEPDFPLEEIAPNAFTEEPSVPLEDIIPDTIAEEPAQ